MAEPLERIDDSTHAERFVARASKTEEEDFNRSAVFQAASTPWRARFNKTASMPRKAIKRLCMPFVRLSSAT